MGYYITSSEITSKSICSGNLLNVLLKATLDGFSFKHSNNFWFIDYFHENLFPSAPADKFDNDFDELEIADYRLKISWFQDFGLDSVRMLELHKCLGFSVFALDPSSAFDSSYTCDYSVGGMEFGGFTIKDGIFTELYHDATCNCFAYLDEDTFDKFDKKLAAADTDEEIDRLVREFCSIEGAEPSDLRELVSRDLDDRILESAKRLNIEMKYEPWYEPRPVKSYANPEFHVNWTGEGTYAVISAAKDTGELASVPDAVRKGYITREQLEAALEVSNKVPDAEVSAILLQLLQETSDDNMSL